MNAAGPARRDEVRAHILDGVDGCVRDQPSRGLRPPAVRRGSRLRIAPQRGYTLIEVIVAFGVLALGLTLLLGTLSGATRQVRHADRAGRAALHAQSLLDQAGIGEALQPGETGGELEDGFYRWTLEVAPYRDPGAPPPGPEALAAPQLMQLVLEVRWGDTPRDRLQLQTLRLVAPDPLAGMGAQ